MGLRGWVFISLSPQAPFAFRGTIMFPAKTLVIFKSVHHHNTAKVAQRIADVLGAVVVTPEETPYTCLDDYDMIGFGSGGRVRDRYGQ